MLFTALFSCKQESLETTKDKAQFIVDQAIKTHGGEAYEQLEVSYKFRKGTYSIHNQGAEFEYTRSFEKDGQRIKDIVNNAGFERQIDGQTISVPDTMVARYSGSVNSVNYFAQLPYHLNDAAVNKTYEGTTTIKDKTYQVVKVTFDEAGGGEDFDDVYYYWFAAENYQLDYLAYSFHVNKGGVRFRSAYNIRTIDGIRFQDYVNYKAAKDTPLADLPKLYEAGELEELSRIELENIEVKRAE